MLALPLAKEAISLAVDFTGDGFEYLNGVVHRVSMKIT